MVHNYVVANAVSVFVHKGANVYLCYNFVPLLLSAVLLRECQHVWKLSCLEFSLIIRCPVTMILIDYGLYILCSKPGLARLSPVKKVTLFYLGAIDDQRSRDRYCLTGRKTIHAFLAILSICYHLEFYFCHFMIYLCHWDCVVWDKRGCMQWDICHNSYVICRVTRWDLEWWSEGWKILEQLKMVCIFVFVFCSMFNKVRCVCVCMCVCVCVCVCVFYLFWVYLFHFLGICFSSMWYCCLDIVHGKT
jgi:hypothetical protein